MSTDPSAVSPPQPAPAPTPAPVAPSPAPAPAPEPVVATRPEWLPESHWDDAANAIKPEFGAHYAEVSAFHKAETERLAAIPQKAEDYKLDPVIPDGVTLPSGMQVKIDRTDPMVVSLLDIAVRNKVPQSVVNDWIAADIKMKVALHEEDAAKIAAADATLGANAKARKEAAGAWLKGLKDRNEITAEEYEAGRVYTIDAHGVTFLEKIMAKATGNVPGHQPSNPTPQQPKTVAERMYPHLPSGHPPASRSA